MDRLENISEVKRRLHRRLTDLSAAVQQKMDQVGMDRKTFQTRIGRSESFVERFFGGGVDVTMQTIAEMEAALDVDLIEVLCDPPAAPKRQTATQQNEMKMPVNHPLPMSMLKDYTIDGKPLNLDKFFSVNDFTYDEKLEILELGVGETLEFGKRVLRRTV